MVIWITGLSGAGKTTLCHALNRLLKPALPELVVLDGDEVRMAFGNEFGHSESERRNQFRRLQGIARLLTRQRIVVVVAAVFNRPDLLQWNRANFAEYVEVYLKCSLDTVQGRDTKGLYAKAISGEISDVVGIDIPWTEPEAPDLVIDGDRPQRPDAWAHAVAAASPRLAGLLKP